MQAKDIKSVLGLIGLLAFALAAMFFVVSGVSKCRCKDGGESSLVGAQSSLGIAVGVLERADTEYQAKGDLSVSKVADDGNQTFIFVSDSAVDDGDPASLWVVNSESGEEAVGFEYLYGAYVVDRVLGKGEQFVLIVGRVRSVIKRK
jgi:hypothetical protein